MLLFEADAESLNVAGGMELLPKESRHGVDWYIFADTRSVYKTRELAGQLRWKP